MSSAPDVHNGPTDRYDHQASERAERRVTALLFSGILVLAIIGIGLSAMAGAMMSHTHHMPISAEARSAAVPAPQRISLFVAPDWKRGPDKERHDAFSKTNFSVKVGQPVRLTIDNRDDTVHSITAPAAGVNVVVMPGVHSYTLVVHQAGRFKWICAYPCDPFAMAHTNYMQGYITAT